jgi:PPK2 family polyphosphate:nucleotide phosphotransferase
MASFLLSMTGVRAPHINIDQFRVKPSSRLKLSDYDPADTAPFENEKDAKKLLASSVNELYRLTELLYAQNRWAVLFVFQAMDGAGKDSAIKHVMRGLDPKSTQVYTFAKPSAEELRHDFLWRCLKVLPERGRIGVFNRSYYEETLVTRVHPELLEAENLPNGCITPKIWTERYEDIRAMERYLTRNGTVIRKIYLNVSKAEQRRRFLVRLSDPAKRWKFSVNDVNERLKWNKYMAAYQDVLKATSTAHAPWYIVPADKKWFTRLVVARIAIETLKSLDLSVPAMKRRQQIALHDAKRRLRAK